MRDKREKWAQLRIRIVAGIFVCCFLAVAVRAFYLQVLKHDDWVKIAERQHLRTVALTPSRGPITDRNGEPLAVSIDMDSCYAEPRRMDEAEAGELGKLARVLGYSLPDLQQKLAASRGFVWLQRRITPELAKQVKELDLDGVGLVKETRRFYPNSELAAHVVGFTGLDPDGLEGIERKYNQVILGNTGYLITERDALGRDIGRKGQVRGGSRGAGITLTIDKTIQYLTEKELAKAVQSSGAKAGIAVVQESRTGKLLAIANYPGFNPNSFGKYPPAALRNRAVADSFEPGSTFKVFLIAAALEEKVVSPGDGFNCENGSYNIGGRTIHDTHKYGRLSVAEVLKYSSNIGAAKIGARLGREKLYSYLKAFGIGDRTGVDLPGEVAGSLRDRGQWFGVDLATISFGQGVTTTAVQLTNGMSAIANGGTLMKPYLVERISDENGQVVKRNEPEAVRRVISPETARTMAQIMEGVTQAGGTGTAAAVEGFRVAGKTGTAQKVDPVTHGYSVDKRTATFIGFIPADDPRLTILVLIDEPKTSPYGGVVAAPAFGAIARQALIYMRVLPAGGLKQRAMTVTASAAPLPVAPVMPTAAEGVIEDGSAGMVMPNFSGMSMRQVMRVMEQRGLNVKLVGSGRVVSQMPRPGERIRPTDQVQVRFEPAA